MLVLVARKFLCLFLVESRCVTVVGEVLQWLSVSQQSLMLFLVFWQWVGLDGILVVVAGKVWISSENLWRVFEDNVLFCGVYRWFLQSLVTFIVAAVIVAAGSSGRRRFHEKDDPCLIAVVDFSLSQIRIILIGPVCLLFQSVQDFRFRFTVFLDRFNVLFSCSV